MKKPSLLGHRFFCGIGVRLSLVITWTGRREGGWGEGVDTHCRTPLSFEILNTPTRSPMKTEMTNLMRKNLDQRYDTSLGSSV